MEAVATLTAGEVLYLYGFVWRTASLPRLEGIEPASEVHLIGTGDIACAASRVSSNEYRDRSAEPEAVQLEWVTQRAWRHHQVLHRLHDAGAAVPLTFGSLCHNVDDLHGLLRQRGAEIARLLAHVEGKDEWTLKMHVDRDAIVAALQAVRPELAPVVDESEMPSGRIYFMRKKRDRAVADAVHEQLAEVQRRVLGRLATCGHEIRRERRADSAATDTGTCAALLVERRRFDELEHTLTALETEHADARLGFELVGPWPPYSFATTLEAAAVVGH